jgi:uncharacterized protein
MKTKLVLTFVLCLFIQFFTVHAADVINTEQFHLVDEGNVTLFVPAVEKTDYGYRGVLATLMVMVKKGNGHVFVDTLPLTEIDTQSSARMAKEAVEEVLGIDLDNYDLYFVIRSDSPIVGGPSAGGAMAVGIIATLLNLTINRAVIMTGTINIDGSIGPVGGLMEKCQAAAEHNATMFLIPQGQSTIYIQKTESESLPGGISIVKTTPIKINLIEYANEKWNISVKEVENVLEALKYITGYEIKRKQKEITSQDIIEKSMRNMSSEYINQINKRLSSVKEKLEKSDISFDIYKQLETILNDQGNELEKAKRLFENKNYYSASSICFGIEIKLNYVENMIDFLKSKNSDLFVENLIRKIENKIDNITSEINTVKNEIDNIAYIVIVSVALDRLSDAKRYLRDAWKNYYNSHYYDSIYYTSYADARANSSLRWLSLHKVFTGEKIKFDFSKLQRIARYRIDEASTFITYAQVLGVSTENAETLLIEAKHEYDKGNYPSALFNAVAAKATVDVELLTRDLDIDELNNRVSAVEESAVFSINDAEKNGAVPIIAISYYEYAKNLENVNDKFLYFVYAKYFARVSKSLLKVMNESYEYEKKTIDIEIIPSNNKVMYCNIYYTLIGVLFGFIISIVIIKITGRKHKKLRKIKKVHARKRSRK